eukprot:COSAG02_NODE_17026_length_1034_cov_1.540107_1_plen_107_part_10
MYSVRYSEQLPAALRAIVTPGLAGCGRSWCTGRPILHRLLSRLLLLQLLLTIQRLRRRTHAQSIVFVSSCTDLSASLRARQSLSACMAAARVWRGGASRGCRAAGDW